MAIPSGWWRNYCGDGKPLYEKWDDFRLANERSMIDAVKFDTFPPGTVVGSMLSVKYDPETADRLVCEKSKVLLLV